MQESAEIIHLLSKLFFQHFGKQPKNTNKLPISGSNRKYYRLEHDENKAIGTYSIDKKENTAFIYFSKVFYSKNLPIPEIYVKDLSNNVYLQEDVGDKNLLDYISKDIENSTNEQISIYEHVIENLIKFQIKGCVDFDYNYCYPRKKFDIQSMLWDLNYFKYYFLKLADFSFNEELLENDFQQLTNFLSSAPSSFFLYRDFQSRNILLKEKDLYFIDYQGGREGALQYDLASLLYDNYVDLSEEIRNNLLQYYIQQLQKKTTCEANDYLFYYYEFALIRLLQAMGAYGFRGLYEKKRIFIQSIPNGQKNIGCILDKSKLIKRLPELHRVLRDIVQSKKDRKSTRLNSSH